MQADDAEALNHPKADQDPYQCQAALCEETVPRSVVAEEVPALATDTPPGLLDDLLRIALSSRIPEQQDDNDAPAETPQLTPEQKKQDDNDAPGPAEIPQLTPAEQKQ